MCLFSSDFLYSLVWAPFLKAAMMHWVFLTLDLSCLFSHCYISLTTIGKGSLFWRTWVISLSSFGKSMIIFLSQVYNLNHILKVHVFCVKCLLIKGLAYGIFVRPSFCFVTPSIIKSNPNCAVSLHNNFSDTLYFIISIFVWNIDN